MQKTIWWIVGIVALSALVWWMFANRTPAQSGTTASSTPITVADPSSLPGIQTTPAPWAPEYANLPARLAADNVAQLAQESDVMHIHQHLDIIIDGQPVAVPANVGVDEKAGYLGVVHTEDGSGVIHVGSPIVATYTLGDFFDAWGVGFASTTLGAYQADATHTLRVYVNGELYTGDPRLLALAEHQEIVIVFGTDAEMPADIPTSYTFAPDE